MITIRPMRRADMDDYMALCRYCFWMTPEGSAVYGEWVRNFLDHAWVAVDQSRLCAGLWYYPYQMRVGDSYLPMGGVAAVATAPEHRNDGLAKMLMTRAHRQMRADGRALAVLMPFKHEFYARMGYGDAFFHHDCLFAPEQIARRDTRKYVLRPIDAEREWPLLERLHQEYGARYLGTVRRDALYWRVRYLRTANGIRQTYLVERGREPKGFIITNLGRDEATLKLRLLVVQAVWSEAGAFDAILQFLRGHRDQVPKINWRMPPDVPLQARLVDPQIEAVLKPKMMLKLVDFKGALEQRTYPNDLNGDVVFTLRADPTSPWNDGDWRVRWQHGKARVSRAADVRRFPNRARADVQTLAVLYSGRRSASDLAAAEDISLGGDAPVLLSAAFPAATPYMDDWF
ncbi:MAG: GNAT family N-acetyltransferase [candidate division Zixibacteria bacterium]|nr:GNAT family N-acetyltransferase [candidate division Zixibacteria bacterium]